VRFEIFYVYSIEEKDYQWRSDAHVYVLNAFNRVQKKEQSRKKPLTLKGSRGDGIDRPD
jgi:hypothetical protein